MGDPSNAIPEPRKYRGPPTVLSRERLDLLHARLSRKLFRRKNRLQGRKYQVERMLRTSELLRSEADRLRRINFLNSVGEAKTHQGNPSMAVGCGIPQQDTARGGALGTYVPCEADLEPQFVGEGRTFSTSAGKSPNAVTRSCCSLRGVVPRPVPAGFAESMESVARDLTDIRDALGNPCGKCRPRLEQHEQLSADRLWVLFQKALLIPDPVERFDKGRMDTLVERLFGTIEIPAAGRDEFGGLVLTDCFHDAHKAFSLYLGRKIFPCSTRKDLKAAGDSAFLRLTTPETPRDARRDHALDLVEKLARDIFTRTSLLKYQAKNHQWNYPVHDTSSVEGSHKRELFYGLKKDSSGNRVAPDHGRVKVVPILSGGKVRTITLDSYDNMQYSYLNGWMSAQVMRERWSIFGKTVSEWMNERPDVAAWDGNFLSGDLECATDLFSPEMADRILDVVAEVAGVDAHVLKRFTTQAPLEWDGRVCDQERGQLMGSFLSFPMLCINTLVPFLISEGLDKAYLAELDRKKRKKQRDAWLVGVNGDDILGCVRDRGKGWADCVPAIGGRASRGKTLVNQHVFTVNSELWVRDQTTCLWSQPASIRPSLLVGISDGRRATPSVLWDSYRNCKFRIRAEVKPLVEARMKPHLPISMGGVQAIKRFVPQDVRGWLSAKLGELERKHTRVDFDSRQDALLDEDARTSRTFWVDREFALEVRREVDRPYRGTARWSNTGRMPPRNIDDIPDLYLEQLYTLEWKKADLDVVEMRLPARVYNDPDLQEYLTVPQIPRRGSPCLEALFEAFAARCKFLSGVTRPRAPRFNSEVYTTRQMRALVRFDFLSSPGQD